MAELDAFLKPEVTKDVRQFFDNPLETVWVIPVTNFIPPHGRQVQDEYCTPTEEVGRKAQLILDAGFKFTSEYLRMVNEMVFYITGQIQEAEDEPPEEGDAAILIGLKPGRAFFDKVDAWIMNFKIPENGIYRRWG